jgi:hypothetical protein
MVSHDFGFRISDFGISARPSEAAKRNVGASFRARPRIYPEPDAVEMTLRRWWRALKDPPTLGIDSRVIHD